MGDRLDTTTRVIQYMDSSYTMMSGHHYILLDPHSRVQYAVKAARVTCFAKTLSKALLPQILQRHFKRSAFSHHTHRLHQRLYISLTP